MDNQVRLRESKRFCICDKDTVAIGLTNNLDKCYVLEGVDPSILKKSYNEIFDCFRQFIPNLRNDPPNEYWMIDHGYIGSVETATDVRIFAGKGFVDTDRLTGQTRFTKFYTTDNGMVFSREFSASDN